MEIVTKELTKADAVVHVLQAFLDAVKVAGTQGAPAGVMYAAVMGMMSLDTFNNVMALLVALKKVRKEGHLYFWLADYSNGAN